jgi:uracil-DNA glycosylase
MNKDKLIELFGEEWYNLLEPFLLSNEFKSIMKTLINESKKNYVIPTRESGLLFKIFKDLQPSSIKVVFLGQDPYHSVSKATKEFTYDGYAFSNSKSMPWEISPSLLNIVKEMRDSERAVLELDRYDWKYLVEQGVFPINTALSVIKGKAGIHTKLWEPFTEYWIKELDTNHMDICWLLLGNHAKKYKDLITNGTIIEAGHPSPLNTKIPFRGTKVFDKINEFLFSVNKRIINW